MFQSLKYKIAAPTLLVVSIFLAAITFTGYTISRNALQRDALSQLSRELDSSHRILKLWIQERFEQLLSISENPSLTSSLSKTETAAKARLDATTLFQNMQEGGGFYESINLVNDKMEVLASSDASTVGKPFVYARTPGFSIQNVGASASFLSARTQQPVFMLVVPAMNEDGDVGALIGVANLSGFVSEYIGNNSAQRFMIADRAGAFCVHPSKPELMKPMSASSFYKQVDAKAGLLDYGDNGTRYLGHYVKDEQHGWTLALSANRDGILASATQVRYLSTALGSAAIVLTACVVLWTASRITRRIRRVAGAIRDIGEGDGDLTQRLEVGARDEIGLLASNFNGFADKLQSLIRELIAGIGELASAATGMADLAGQLNTTTDEMTAKSAGIVASGTELSTSLQRMADLADKVSSSAAAVAAATEQMTSSLGGIAQTSSNGSRIASEADQQTRRAREMVTRLGETANGITRILEVISGIADQTNLLALNATIEAASAGDAGKGFAVVANEVKQLARESASATEKIEGQIGSIQAGTTEVEGAVAETSRIVENVNQMSMTLMSSVEQQTSSASEIARNIASASDAARTLAEEIAQAAGNAQSLASGIDAVSSAANRNGKSAASTSHSAGTLASLADRLKQLVNHFKV